MLCVSISSHSRLCWHDSRKEILLWNIVKSEYRRFLSFISLWWLFREPGVSVVEVLKHWQNLNSQLILAHACVIIFLLSCSGWFCWFLICEEWVVTHFWWCAVTHQWCPGLPPQHSCRTQSSLLQALCSSSCLSYHPQNWHPAQVQWLESSGTAEFNFLGLLNWLVNLKQWPALGSSVKQQSRSMSENRKRLSESALCAPLSKDTLTGFPIILTCSSHPIIWTLSK